MTDHLNKSGAEKLAQRLAEFWRNEGYDVQPVIRRYKSAVVTGGGWVYAVELPDFVGGLPPASARINSAAPVPDPRARGGKREDSAAPLRAGSSRTHRRA